MYRVRIVVGRTLSAMKEAFELLDTAAKKMGLTVNVIATNYTVAGHGRALALQKLTIQEHTF